MGFTTADMPPIEPEEFEKMLVMERMNRPGFSSYPVSCPAVAGLADSRAA